MKTIVIITDDSEEITTVAGPFDDEDVAIAWIELASKTTWAEKADVSFHITQLTDPKEITGE